MKPCNELGWNRIGFIFLLVGWMIGIRHRIRPEHASVSHTRFGAFHQSGLHRFHYPAKRQRAASVGKAFPRVPEWRIKGILDYAPTDRWFVTLAGQYASDQYSELDNSDIAGGYGGVDEYFTLDARFGYRFARHWTASLGVDNITDELYHVSHPYPRRTYFAELKFAY